jgi:hypothetical protein
MKLVIFFTSIIICINIGFAQNTNSIIPKTYVASKTVEEINIDGKDIDVSWGKIKWSDDFIDIEGIKKPKYKTQVKMLWDEEYCYILARMEEPHVWANIKKRDTVIFYNNDFELFIDPDGDTHNYYELEINALNTPWDMFITKPYRDNNVVVNDFDIVGLKSAIHISGTLNNSSDLDKEWFMEIAIPWSTFRTSFFQDNVPRDKFWRFNFSRVNWQHEIIDGKYQRKKDNNGTYLPEYNWVWSPTGVINIHLPEKWGYVFFSSKEAGTEVPFCIPNDEKIKWQLYYLYRKQKKYFENNKNWANSIKSLSDKDIIVDSNVLQPTLELHQTGWNIKIVSPFTNKTFIIKEDGKLITK